MTFGSSAREKKMMFAQSLVEYGLASAIATFVDQAWLTISDVIANPGYRILSIVGGVVLAWMSLRRFSRK